MVGRTSYKCHTRPCATTAQRCVQPNSRKRRYGCCGDSRRYTKHFRSSHALTTTYRDRQLERPLGYAPHSAASLAAIVRCRWNVADIHPISPTRSGQNIACPTTLSCSLLTRLVLARLRSAMRSPISYQKCPLISGGQESVGQN